ncbi:sensor histidine kinase, partial [Achromobacter xylosoxidans]
RNPLGGLRTAVQTLRQFGERAEVRQESLGFIDRGVEALQAVVDASLRTFRPGDARLRQADVEDVRLLVAAQAGRAGVEVSLACAGMGPDTLPLPAGPVRQVLLNLVLNAVQAAPPGSPVRIVARAHAGALALHVADRGAGLPPQARAALAGEPSGGDGMGLGIVAGLVAGLGGRARVCSRGQDTRISVRIPLPREGQTL